MFFRVAHFIRLESVKATSPTQKADPTGSRGYVTVHTCVSLCVLLDLDYPQDGNANRRIDCGSIPIHLVGSDFDHQRVLTAVVVRFRPSTRLQSADLSSISSQCARSCLRPSPAHQLKLTLRRPSLIAGGTRRRVSYRLSIDRGAACDNNFEQSNRIDLEGSSASQRSDHSSDSCVLSRRLPSFPSLRSISFEFAAICRWDQPSVTGWSRNITSACSGSRPELPTADQTCRTAPQLETSRHQASFGQ
jgi:hypothetical protein